MKKTIIIDSDIPYIRGIFDKVANIQYIKGKSITPETVADADALIIRTRTKCNEELLKNSKVSFIGTATIGVDHIDTEYCSTHGIEVCNAPGCNANAVAQYVWNAIIHFYYKKNTIHSDNSTSVLERIQHLKLGIIGFGHVGKAVANIANHLGISYHIYDPPLAKILNDNNLDQLDEVLNCDIITVHTPLTTDGEYPTMHMIDEKIFSIIEKKGKQPLIINAARGGIIDEVTLLRHLDKGTISGCIIDCWEGEPRINKELLDIAFISTPHIAGYSVQGKYNATQQIVNKLSTAFNYSNCIVETPDIKQKQIHNAIELAEAFFNDDRLVTDSNNLRNNPENFELQRNKYDYRTELNLLF